MWVMSEENVYCCLVALVECDEVVVKRIVWQAGEIYIVYQLKLDNSYCQASFVCPAIVYQKILRQMEPVTH